MTLEEMRDTLLDNALRHVSVEGWSNTALASGGADLALEAGSVDLLFPGGVREALAYFSRRADLRMVAASESVSELPVHKRIESLINTRLDILLPHREAVRRGLVFLAMPGNATLGLRLLNDTVNELWYAAGDRSADFSYYTKRVMLAAVLSSTTLFWTNDSSKDCQDTREFLSRRLTDVMRVHRARGRLEELAAFRPLRVASEVICERYGR